MEGSKRCMNIIELKNKIEDKTLDDSFLVLQYSDVSFIARQYVEEISNFKNRPIVYVDSLDSIAESIFGDDGMLYVMNTDKITTPIKSSSLNNKIIICKSIDENVLVDLKEHVIEIPKLQQWQIRAYASKNLPGLSNEEVNWLCDITKDIYRLSNEVDKIKIFNKKEQSSIFRLLNEEDSYSDLNSNTIFNFTNAITKRNIKAVKNILETIETMDVESMGVMSILYKSFKNIINVQMNLNATHESVGMSQKQFNAIRYNLGKYTNGELVRIFDTITSIDSALKGGNLPETKIIEYLLINIL